ncbi:MAG TPA: TorF family putative porin, partial [Phenylobacterium sp.]
MSRFAIPLAALALGLAASSGARAQPAPPSAWGGLFSAVTLGTDYRYQGVSESRGRPVVQGYVHWWRPDGYFAGVFATKVDFGYSGAPTYEVDAYAGKSFRLDGGRSELKLQAMSSSFPDNRTPGPTFDFLQGSVQLQHTAGPWTTRALVSYVPESSYGSGPVARAEGEADYALSKSLTLKALAGTQGGGRGHDRTYWSLGGVWTWKTLAFDLSYQTDDRTRANCGFQPKA